MRDNNYSFWQIIQKAFAYWYVIVAVFGLAMFAAYFYLQRTQPKYKATASLLIKDENNQPDEELVFSEFGLGKKNKNLENEMQVLKSTPLMYQVVESMELQYQFTEVDGWEKRDLYKQTALKVLDWQPVIENEGLDATLTTDVPEGYRLVVEDEEYLGEFGKELQLPTGKLTLLRSGDASIENEIQVRILSIWKRAKEFVSNFEVEVMGENSSVLFLSLKDLNPRRAQEVLTALIEVYNQKTIDDKNRVFENAIKFIDDRIKLISGELSETESDVENYKRKYNVVELSSEGKMIMTELSNFNRQMSDAEVQMEILNSIQAFLVKNRKNFEFVPTNLSLNNLTLSKQLDYFNKLLAERDVLKSELGKSHPDLILVEKQIQNFRHTIINNIYTIKKDLELELGANNELRTNLERRLQSLPKRERELINIERKKNIKENLYLYLLQKREESAISLAVTAATGSIVEPPSFSDPVSPIPAQIWLIAAFLGLAIPMGLILLLDNLNDKVQSENDILMGTSLPLAGVIAQAKGKNKVIVQENTFNPQAELFRLVRSNIPHVIQNDKLQSLLITSSSNEEGKSYIAMNLAMANALTGRRVVIVEVDMRSAQQEKYGRSATAQIGVMDYLTNPSMTVDHIIENSGSHALVDIINGGTRGADPSKMVLSARLRELVTHLKERYDFIILDAPPVDMLADTLEMADLAEATMFIVRAGVTNEKELRIIDVVAKNERLPKPFIVLNGVSKSKIKHNSFLLGHKVVQPAQNGHVKNYKNTVQYR